MTRVFNFCAGPAALPTAVLEKAGLELADWHGKGLSIMEMSHRSKDVIDVCKQAELDLRELMSIPDNYKVLFMQGGASSQFAMIPLNLANGSGKVDQIVTGQWSKKALAEGKRFADVQVAATTADNGFTSAPSQDELVLRPDADYVHYCPNETIGGVAFDYIPETGDVPLVADLSSMILAGPLDVSRFGMIYAGAQKNIGPAGITIVIIRDDLIGHAGDNVPAMLNYAIHAKADSM
ncbi:MAG: 3-phosphoserine/phosphohydroxythreonine transaminase, partial [Oceanobacter sp.]